MVTQNITNLTLEQRAAAVAKSIAARKRKAAERAASTLRRDFLDNSHWEELAQARGVTLPTWGDAPTPNPMRAFLRKVRVSIGDYFVWSGESTMQDFAKGNPTWPARAWAGLVIEALDAGVLKATP